LVCLLSLGFGPSQAATPSPSMSPSDVVETVLQAMARNDQPSADAGIEMAYRFASPANRASLGPYWHFVAVVKQPAYAPLINHANRELGQPTLDERSASIPVIVVGSSGEVAGYLWSLSKQTDGDYADSWMTDSVVRVPLGPDLKAL